MHLTSRLAALNSLVPMTPGIWVGEGEVSNFEYSDGDEAENRLESVLNTVSDCTNLSIELEHKITDWPSEYHFSPTRGNLLRYLNLDNKSSILELGCGCGALTRYLGDLGLDIDAVEGSSKRARLARLRCKDLNNVTIVSYSLCGYETIDASARAKV